MTSLINANSPMVWDATMLGAAETYARNNQAPIITPIILSGAMSPVSVAGRRRSWRNYVRHRIRAAGATRRARDLRDVRVHALDAVRRPDLWNARGRQGDLRRGPTRAPTQHAFRTGGSLCASKIPDAQAAYDSAQTLVPTMHAGTNFVLHAAGWLEGGLSSSYEKLIMDMDQLGMMHVLAKGIDLSENGQTMDALREVGPGSHFLGCAHTQANFETAFFRSTVADNNSVEQ